MLTSSLLPPDCVEVVVASSAIAAAIVFPPPDVAPDWVRPQYAGPAWRDL